MAGEAKARQSIFQRLDQLNEFERKPVTKDKLHGWMYFAGSFAGEHVAATEFVIGALFVAGGASVQDVLVGLLIGNLLAVLSWTLVCAPIAVQTRLTLYWYLRRIAGPGVTFVYNILNAVLYCVLAGCMITVSASAVRIPFGIPPQTGWLPTDPWFVVVTVCVGAVVVLLAILGFKSLARFAAVCSPWMLTMFIAGALLSFPVVGTFSSLKGFWLIGKQRIWTGPPPYEEFEIVSDGRFGNYAGILITFPEGTKLTAIDVSSAFEEPSESEESYLQPETPLLAQQDDGQTDTERPAIRKTQPTQTSEPKPVELVGFVIAGQAAGEHRFVPAQAKLVADNQVFVWSTQITKPAAVAYGETNMFNLCTVDSNGQTTPVPAFRTYVARRDRVYSFWHIAAFAWICNLAMHLGLSDMALFRYAPHWLYGLFSAFGMYLGHYLAWICAGVMGAAVASAAMANSPLTLLDSGEVAFQVLGVAGALAVVIAGWTTSNPTLYRAGLALQVVTPGWPRWLVTLLAGAVTTAVACFPFVFRQLLNFVALYGILLMPVGTVVVVEHWLFPLLRLERYWTERDGKTVNWAALVAWLAGIAVALGMWYFHVIHEFFLAVPIWILTAVLYILLAALLGAGKKRARQTAAQQIEEPQSDEPPASDATQPGSDQPPVSPGQRQPTYHTESERMRFYFWLIAALSLLSIIGFSYCRFLGFLAPNTVFFQYGNWKFTFDQYLLFATLVYFVAATTWMTMREKAQQLRQQASVSQGSAD